ncbi:MAG: ABC transporter ATP-binding protein, partial [Planctomycetota bacterium]
DDLSLTIAGRRILDAVSLQVRDTAIAALLGPSGSGKTSLLRSIMGLTLPQTGRCRLDEEDLQCDGRVLVPPERRSIAYLFQHFTLYPHLDVKRNILLGIRSVPREQRRQRLHECAELLRIGHLLDRDIHHLSGGEQQRVALARTLALRPRLLLLDEPFSNLDANERRRLAEEVKALIRARGMTAVLATHDQEEAFFFADDLGIMRDGRILASGSPRTLYERPASEWLARFTGQANILSGRQLRTCLGGSLTTDVADDGRYLLRPEQLRLQPGADADLSVVRIDFFGHSSRLTLRSRTGLELIAVQPGAADLAVGQGVSLALASEAVRLTA